MILSGLESDAAGVGFIACALHEKTHIEHLGGYAIVMYTPGRSLPSMAGLPLAQGAY
jgi:hypothetical protein